MVSLLPPNVQHGRPFKVYWSFAPTRRWHSVDRMIRSGSLWPMEQSLLRLPMPFERTQPWVLWPPMAIRGRWDRVEVVSNSLPPVGSADAVRVTRFVPVLGIATGVESTVPLVVLPLRHCSSHFSDRRKSSFSTFNTWPRDPSEQPPSIGIKESSFPWCVEQMNWSVIIRSPWKASLMSFIGRERVEFMRHRFALFISLHWRFLDSREGFFGISRSWSIEFTWSVLEVGMEEKCSISGEDSNAFEIVSSVWCFERHTSNTPKIHSFIQQCWAFEFILSYSITEKDIAVSLSFFSSVGRERMSRAFSHRFRPRRKNDVGVERFISRDGFSEKFFLFLPSITNKIHSVVPFILDIFSGEREKTILHFLSTQSLASWERTLS